LLAGYVTVVEDRPIMSAEYCVPVPVFHFWPKLTRHASRRGLSEIAELLVIIIITVLVPRKKSRFLLLLFRM